jgi:hypothetical protein
MAGSTGPTGAGGTSSGSDEDITSTSLDTCGFICEDENETEPGPLGDSCSTFEQDCPVGQKCTTTYMQGAGDYVDHCVDVHPHARWVGEPCQLTGENGIEGDNCVLGSLCWDPDPITGIGMCVELCGGTENTPLCDTPDTFCAYGKSIQLCMQLCEPRDLETCPVGCTCVPAVEIFMCVLNASGDLGAYGDPCEYANGCDPGNFCLNPGVSPDCDPQSGGCCIPACDTAAPDCPPGLQCLGWYAEEEVDTIPDGYETLGYCGVPQ